MHEGDEIKELLKNKPALVLGRAGKTKAEKKEYEYCKCKYFIFDIQLKNGNY